MLEPNRAVFRKEPQEAFPREALVFLRLARLHAGESVGEQAVGAQQQRLPLGGQVAQPRLLVPV